MMRLNSNLYYDVVLHQVFNHQAYVFVIQDVENGIFGLNDSRFVGTIENDIVSNKIKFVNIDLGKQNRYAYLPLIVIGVWHILQGYDHLLFLFALLLTVRLKRVANKWDIELSKKKVISKIVAMTIWFTIGHSISLLIGSYSGGIISVRVIEYGVIATLFFSAVHCIKPIFNQKKINIVLFFGLIHDFAFAELTQQLDVDVLSKLLSILFFNLGVEVGQVLFLSVLIPLLFSFPIRYFMKIKNAIAVFILLVCIYLIAMNTFAIQ